MRGAAGLFYSAALAAVSCGGNGSSKLPGGDSVLATPVIDSQVQQTGDRKAPADTAPAMPPGTGTRGSDSGGGFQYGGPPNQRPGGRDSATAGVLDTEPVPRAPGHPGTTDTNSAPRNPGPGVSDTGPARSAGLETRARTVLPGTVLRGRSTAPLKGPGVTDTAPARKKVLTKKPGRS
jgi:hypothetical protein